MKRKFLTAIATAFVPFLVTAGAAGSALAVQADNASSYWEGANASGAIVKGEDCPVVVEKETLHFHISSLPREGKVELSGYISEAVAEYTFYNPTADDYDMTLLFPFGVFPSYVAPTATDEISTVSVEGNSAACRVRHSYASSAFDAEKDLERVLDEKKADAFYCESTPVSEYRVTLASGKASEGDTLNLKLSYNPRRTRVIFPAEGTRLCVSGGDMCAAIPLSGTSASALFYAVGAPIVRVSSATEGEPLLEPSVTNMTFAQFAMMGWSADTGVSEVDWYNAVVDMLNDKNMSAGVTDSFGFTPKNLMRWYEYDMKIPAGERVVSRVKTPLYPTVEGNKNPRYEYSYLLSPAAKWADLQSLEIRIETPYLLANGSLDFTKAEGGEGYTYLFTRSSLPQGELTFVLMENEDADSDFNVFDNSFLRPTITWAFVTLTVLAGVAAVITVIAIVTLKKKNR